MSKKSYQVKINILNNSNSFVDDPLFLSGTFNNWAEHLKIGLIPQQGEQITYLLENVKSGDLELKISRGNWDNLSSSKEGKLELPHISKIQKDSEVNLTIEAWRDQFPKSTASKQVHVLDEHFFFPDLNVFRKVWIYLPKDYATSSERYPVIYMHDGQHLFDEATSVGRAGPVEWMVDETIDEANIPAIVIAIDHAKTYELRQQEYLVNPSHTTEKAQGWDYLEDIVNSLKPFVDKHYRTIPDAMHTAMIGSSIAALLSIYAGIKYPQVFGTIASFSPSIWMDEQNLYNYSKKKLQEKGENRKNQELYFYIGDKERRFRLMDEQNNMKLDLDKYYDWLKGNYEGELKLDLEFEGKHGAIYWQKAFAKFYDYWQTKLNSIK